MITIKQVEITEIETLVKISRETFFTAFAPFNQIADMNSYANQAFTKDKLLSELNEPNSKFYFAYHHEQMCGYIKLNYKTAQTEFKDPDAIEVERIYIIETYQNKQIGKKLLNFAIEQGVIQGLKYVWLGVWENNVSAIRFYELNGFKIFSSHKFMLGSDKQTDLLMKKII